ncbi:hypothetical protein NVV93_10245 [Pseudomonas sp. LS44]|uniref:hypothetical protein n=1 Tax=Pseudomonas sp. LS44 TaxID=1357074 RepID=UPI00215B0985|nr:hypothetical protein [Pseudomonas sp. LS44]UVE16035.1 hypothetical protein NVV93_10245 [Pseudomonas sp. LS44]
MSFSPLTARSLRVVCIAALALLAGCEAAENAAQKLAEKAQLEVEQTARNALNETAKELNKQIDQAQKSTEQWLDGNPTEGDDVPDTQAEDTPERDQSIKLPQHSA